MNQGLQILSVFSSFHLFLFHCTISTVVILCDAWHDNMHFTELHHSIFEKSLLAPCVVWLSAPIRFHAFCLNLPPPFNAGLKDFGIEVCLLIPLTL